MDGAWILVRSLIRSRGDQRPGTSLTTTVSCLRWVCLERRLPGNLGLFWEDDAPFLVGESEARGAENVEMTTDHDSVRTKEAAKALMYEWLSTLLSPDARRQN